MGAAARRVREHGVIAGSGRVNCGGTGADVRGKPAQLAIMSVQTAGTADRQGNVSIIIESRFKHGGEGEPGHGHRPAMELVQGAPLARVTLAFKSTGCRVDLGRGRPVTGRLQSTHPEVQGIPTQTQPPSDQNQGQQQADHQYRPAGDGQGAP